MHTVGYVHTIA